MFPISKDTVISKIVCEFTLVDGTKKFVESLVDKKDWSEHKYEDSVSKNKTPILSEAPCQSCIQHRIRFGNFPPKAEAVLTVYFYQQLEFDDYSFKLVFPAIYIPTFLGEIHAYLNSGSLP